MIRQGYEYGTPTLTKPSKEFVNHKRQSLSPEDSLTRKLNRQSSAFSPPSRGLEAHTGGAQVSQPGLWSSRRLPSRDRYYSSTYSAMMASLDKYSRPGSW